MLKPAIAAFAAMLALTATAAAGERLRLMQVPLDMPLENELDGEYLEGIYQEKLSDVLRDSVLYDAPIARIESGFTEERKLKIWFTSNEDGRRAYWIELNQIYPDDKPVKSQSLIDDFEKTYGKADLIVGAIGGEPSSVIAIKIDPNLDEPRKSEALRSLQENFRLDATQLSDFWRMDMRQRARLLGSDFRGAILTFYQNDGQATAMTEELLDLRSAKTVLNLDLP